MKTVLPQPRENSKMTFNNGISVQADRGKKTGFEHMKQQPVIG